MLAHTLKQDALETLQRQVLQMIHTMIEHAQFKQQTTEGSNPHANA